MLINMLAHHNHTECTVYTGNPACVVHPAVWDKVMVVLFDIIVPYTFSSQLMVLFGKVLVLQIC